MQIAAFGRDSSVHFKPDTRGDLFFDGVASDISRTVYAGGLQTDMSYALFGGKHTVRAGFMVLDESAPIHTTTGVFPTDADGNPTDACHPWNKAPPGGRSKNPDGLRPKRRGSRICD